jgi:hypothetical protein
VTNQSPPDGPTSHLRAVALQSVADRAALGSHFEVERDMKSWVWTGLTAAAVALPALSFAAWAEGTDDYGCSNATLNGEYAFGVTGYLPSPLVVAVMAVFDGQGNYMQRDYAGDSLRTTHQTDFAPKGQEQGTYKVNPDCTGSMVINLNAPISVGSTGVIKGVFVISDGGRHLNFVVSEFTPPGLPGPVPTQTSSEGWKVASDR